MQPLVSLANSSSSSSSAAADPDITETSLDMTRVASFDEALLPARSKIILPLLGLLILMILNSYMGTSAWWYTGNMKSNLVYGFVWGEVGLALVSAGYLLYLRYYGMPRVRGAGFERTAVYSDSHYFWATLCVIAAIGVSCFTIMFFGAWRVAFASYDGFLTTVKVSSLGLQVAKMHSDYLIMHLFHTMGTIVYALCFYGAVHREYNPMFSSSVDAILKAKSSEAKAKAIIVAQQLGAASVLR